MANQPSITSGDWITVGQQECVVMKVYPAKGQYGVALVVFNKSKPTTHDIDWDGDQWFFPKRPDFGGYGRTGDKYVEQLKRGRNTSF